MENNNRQDSEAENTEFDHGLMPLESRTSQIEDVLKEKLERAFHKPTYQVIVYDIAKIAMEHDPIDLAYSVCNLPPSARVIVYDNLPDLNAKIIFMINTGSKTRAAIFKQIDDREIKQLLESTPPDEAVWMLDDMSDRRMKRVLEMLDPKKAQRIRDLQQHDRHSAGRLMTNEFFAFPMSATIGEAAAHIRDNPGIELTQRIFVLNDENQLAGYVLGRNLIINPSEIPLRQVMRPILHKVTVDVSRDDVVDLMERYNIPALPVVDEEERLVGVVTEEDAVEAIKDIADETIASIAGTGEEIGEEEKVISRFFLRAPWLIVTICAGLITATVMSLFYGRLWFTFVPFFVPLIAGMSGNVGIQCSTLLVRGMSTGSLASRSTVDVIRSEIGVGVLIGTAFGIGGGLLALLLNYYGVHHLGSDPIALGVTISCGIFVASIVATLLGTCSPLIFAKLRFDPAVASGPIVTAFNDVLSTVMFLLVAKVMYAFFGEI